MGNNESVTLSNIPANVTYTVTENSDTYESDGGKLADNSAFADDDKTIEAGDEDFVTFTNTKNDGNIDTGITMDSIPYIVLLALAVVGIAAVTMKKRYEA